MPLLREIAQFAHITQHRKPTALDLHRAQQGDRSAHGIRISVVGIVYNGDAALARESLPDGPILPAMRQDRQQ